MSAEALPEFVAPMLAKLGRAPFDSDDYWFEVKWDGFRTLSFVDRDGYRLLSRNRQDFKPRYPELAFLEGMEPGLVLDGELVALRDGKPSFELMLRRQQGRGAGAAPVTYVVFDVLYRGFEPCMDRPFSERRESLREIVAACGDPGLVLSEGVAGSGTSFFEEIKGLGLEGMVAKRLNSRYLSGQRSEAWTKVKTTQHMHCAIVGYALDDGGDLKSLIVATNEADLDGGELRCVGRVGSGIGGAMRSTLLKLLRERSRLEPLIDCGDVGGEWVEPGLYCTVSYIERTSAGHLRAPVFVDLIDPE